MALRGEYDEDVNWRKQATVAVCSMALIALLPGIASAQIHGAPPSVTSMGFGGRAINGTPPSVTSLGRHGFTTPGQSLAHGSHRRPQPAFGYYGWPYYGFYGDGYYDSGDQTQSYAPPEETAVGPTVMDRRGGYVPPEPEEAAEASAPIAAPDADPVQSPPTVLVFKDGHELEVQNYAIVGSTLYDLTEGHRRKVPLSELDLTATSQQNDDRGVDFNLPSSTFAN